MKVKFNNLNDEEFLEKLLDFINLLTPDEKKITSLEKKVLVLFTLLPEERFKYQRFSTLAKNKVLLMAKERNWILSKINLNNKIYGLIEKGFLRRDEDSVIYVPDYILKAYNEFIKNKSYEFNILLTKD